MELNSDYFRAIQGATGCNNKKEVKVAEVKRRFARDFDTSINVNYDTLRNDIVQNLIVLPTKKETVCTVKSRPDEFIFIGDIITYNKSKWLVTKLKTGVNICCEAVIEKCNFKMRYQLHNSTIIEQWCLITNSYSEISSDGKVVSTPIGKTVMLLPYNENTRRIHKDKRIMTETVFTKDNSEIGVVYKVTGFDGKLHDYGADGRLIELGVESTSYLESTDNIVEMIADYISPTSPPIPPTPNPTLLKCEVAGRSSIRVGGSARRYTAKFYGVDGIAEAVGIIPKWEFVCKPELKQYFTLTPIENFIDIVALDNETIIGEMVSLKLTDIGGLYAETQMKIEVVM
ncbi:MAG: hypothetical protein RSF40_01880 [Oscillospiraceae bacterium]